MADSRQFYGILGEISSKIVKEQQFVKTSINFSLILVRLQDEIPQCPSMNLANRSMLLFETSAL